MYGMPPPFLPSAPETVDLSRINSCLSLNCRFPYLEYDTDTYFDPPDGYDDLYAPLTANLCRMPNLQSITVSDAQRAGSHGRRFTPLFKFPGYVISILVVTWTIATSSLPRPSSHYVSRLTPLLLSSIHPKVIAEFLPPRSRSSPSSCDKPIPDGRLRPSSSLTIAHRWIV